jgi:hypothetical protein
MMIVRRPFAWLTLWISSTAAAPAVVWSSRQNGSPDAIHSSIEVPAHDVLGSFLTSEIPSESSTSRVSGVVFLLGREEDGSESLSNLASRGSLPLVADEYQNANVIHHNVQGLDSAGSKLLDSVKRSGNRVLDVSLAEFSKKLSLLDVASVLVEVDATGSVAAPAVEASKSVGKRARALANANVLLVKVDVSKTLPSDIDNAVVQAIRHSKVDTVVLAGARSVDEVKEERNGIYHRKLQLMDTVARSAMGSSSRRLEENAGDDANNNGNQDLTGVYYVSMTPNILAGILFTFLFTFVILVAISCMGMIAGQDTYVSKYPSIGREA